MRSCRRLASSTSGSWPTSGVAPEAPLTGETPAVNRAEARIAYPGEGPSTAGLQSPVDYAASASLAGAASRPSSLARHAACAVDGHDQSGNDATPTHSSSWCT